MLFRSPACLPACLPAQGPDLPGDGEVVLSLAAGSDHHVSLVHGLHHLLGLPEVDVVEGGVGDHTLDVGWWGEGETEIGVKWTEW